MPGRLREPQRHKEACRYHDKQEWQLESAGCVKEGQSKGEAEHEVGEYTDRSTVGTCAFES